MRRADEQEDGAEVAAASAICQLFAEGPGEVDEPIAGWDPQATAALLERSEPAGWPEVAACRAWLELYSQKQSHPDEIPPALDPLVEACRQSRWFPLWLLACRALAYYDRRQTIGELLAEALTRAFDGACGFALVAAEARLECARQAPELDALLRDLDPASCLPLTPQVARPWQRLLMAETAWWRGEVPESTGEFDLTGFLTEPGPADDPYSAREYRRLAFRAALLAVRRTIPEAAAGEALRRFEAALCERPDSWERHYLDGLVRWASRDLRGARQCLEESLAANPFQSRVRFDLGTLYAEDDPAAAKPYLEAAPGVHDADAAAAVWLFSQGHRVEARERLESLAHDESSFSVRWIWPRARASRLRQGRELLAHLTEESGNWLEAVKRWDEARQEPDSAKLVRDPIHRAHRTYLLGRYVYDRGADRETGQVGEGPEEEALSTRFHQELGKLSARTLLGDAMFYRSLAAAPALPQRAVADWRALLRQSAWLDVSCRTAPQRLLHLGDRLLREGFRDDACTAYERARESQVPGARERWRLGELARQDAEADSPGLMFKAPEEPTLGEAQTFCIEALSRLARQPGDSGVGELLERARELGPPPRWQALASALAVLARDRVAPDLGPAGRSGERPRLDESVLELLPPALRAGFECLYRPQGLATLRALGEAFGPQWKSWCPVSPEELLARHLEACCRRRDARAAEEQMRGGEELGIELDETWRLRVFLTMAIRCALEGDFAAAEAARQRALEVLIGGGEQEGDDDDDAF